MRHFDFPPDVLAVIERDRYRHAELLGRQRMEILWLKSHGETHVRIAELAGVARSTVQRVLDLYLAGGLESVRTFHWYKPVSKLAPHRSLLEEEFTLLPPHTVAEACQRIEQLTGMHRSPTRVAQFLHETMGLRWRKVAAVPVPPKLTVEEHAANQAAFLKDGA